MSPAKLQTLLYGNPFDTQLAESSIGLTSAQRDALLSLPRVALPVPNPQDYDLAQKWLDVTTLVTRAVTPLINSNPQDQELNIEVAKRVLDIGAKYHRYLTTSNIVPTAIGDFAAMLTWSALQLKADDLCKYTPGFRVFIGCAG